MASIAVYALVSALSCLWAVVVGVLALVQIRVEQYHFPTAPSVADVPASRGSPSPAVKKANEAPTIVRQLHRLALIYSVALFAWSIDMVRVQLAATSISSHNCTFCDCSLSVWRFGFVWSVRDISNVVRPQLITLVGRDGVVVECR